MTTDNTPVSKLSKMVNDGPFRDIFLALQAQYIFAEIGEHAERVNASSFRPVFATLQAYACDGFILAITRLLERERKQYPLQSVHGVLNFLRAHASDIPLRQPTALRQAIERLGYSADAFDGRNQTTEVLDALLSRLPQVSENEALAVLRTLRDKQIAHPERIEVESMPRTTWENAETLLKIPTEALAVCGAYLSNAYVDNQGRLFMITDAQIAASATRRLLREALIITG